MYVSYKYCHQRFARWNILKCVIYVCYRYSSMDAEEMQRKSTDGQYWTNSCFALIATVMHSTDMWHLSNLIKHNKPFVKMTPFLSESIKEKLQVGGSACA